MGSKEKVYVNNGQITRIADPLNNKFEKREEMNKHIQNFLLILGASILASILGAIFAVLLSHLSPELIHDLFGLKRHPVRFAASVGMLWGLSIGAGAMAFCLGIAAVANWFRPKSKTED